MFFEYISIYFIPYIFLMLFFGMGTLLIMVCLYLKETIDLDDEIVFLQQRHQDLLTDAKKYKDQINKLIDDLTDQGQIKRAKALYNFMKNADGSFRDKKELKYTWVYVFVAILILMPAYLIMFIHHLNNL